MDVSGSLAPLPPPSLDTLLMDDGSSATSNDERDALIERLSLEARQERRHREHLEQELSAERETIEQLLNQMDTLELESRASLEEITDRERTLQYDLIHAQKALEDERAIRLQHVYELSRAQENVDDSRKEVRKLNASVLELQEDFQTQSTHVSALETSLRASERIVEQNEKDLRSTAAANFSHKEDTHLLRTRLVEAEQEITRWRHKYEDSVDAAARERTEMGRIYHQQRIGEKPTGAATMGRPSRSSDSKKGGGGARATTRQQQLPELNPNMLPPRLRNSR